jgi:hypothetical protein
MTIRQPVVIGNDGLLQQLQAGDSLNAPTNTPSIRSVANGESATALVIGMPIYASAADTVKRAQANAKSTCTLAGVVYDPTIAAAASGNIAQSGVLIATTAQWDVVAGTTGGLVFNTLYFVDPTNAGKLTSTAPTTVGQCITVVGRALSSTELELQISQPILL